MDLSTHRRYSNLLNQIGTAAINAIYPNDFEYYYMALELADSNDKTLAYFGFPINPSSIQKTEPKRINVKKSASALTVITNNSPIPQEITLKGNFGRNFKILFSAKEQVDGRAWGFISNSANALKLEFPDFSSTVKTGYGCIKLMQRIIQEADELDNNGLPKRLYFYNLALSESYLVKTNVSGVSFNQSEDQNRIWNYTLPFTILSKLDDLSPNFTEKSNRGKLSTAMMQEVVSTAGELVLDFVVKFNDLKIETSQNLKDFGKKITFDIEEHLNNFVDFVQNKFKNIVKYYKGEVSFLSQETVNQFEELEINNNVLDELIEGYSLNFKTVDGWEFVELIDEISTTLSTIKNFNKWSRSSYVNNQVNIDIIQKQNQSMESILKNSGSVNYDNDWVPFSLTNKIKEEDYTPQGGAKLKLILSNNSAITIDNVVDSLDGINIFGKDVKKSFNFTDNDLETVDLEECLDQMLDTIFSTFQGSIPEFPELGLSNELIGSNINSLQYPSIVRSLSNIMRGDDRFSSIELLNIKNFDDNVSMDVNVRTKIGKNKLQVLNI